MRSTPQPGSNFFNQTMKEKVVFLVCIDKTLFFIIRFQSFKFLNIPLFLCAVCSYCNII